MQTNGLTLCRKIAEKLPQGYLTKIGDGRTYGEALLDPSAIYVNFVGECQKQGLKLNYVSHITGHGWRKLMRLDEPFVYQMDYVPQPQPVFSFIQHSGPVDQREMYATFNMGAGFAAYVSPKDADRCVQIAQTASHQAWKAGTVQKQGGRKAVEIIPLGITFEGDTLKVR